jgi:2-haloacid dehalogenase
LTWDCILSAELAQHYKPDPEAYLLVGRLLDLPQDRLMMVAAHSGDLVAARQTGMRTAFIRRPLEYGERGTPDLPPPHCDLIVDDLHELAERLR